MLWSALRSVEEVMLLLQQAARSARERRDLATAEDELRAAEAYQRAEPLRGVVTQHRVLARGTLEPRARERPGTVPPTNPGGVS